jgi:hypothetical protein
VILFLCAKEMLEFYGAVASSSSSALHQKAGRTSESRGYEDQGAHHRARCVALVSSSFYSFFASAFASVNFENIM